MIVFRFSGEHETLPIEEVRALYEAYGREFEILERTDRLLLVKGSLSPHILSRLALTHGFYPTDIVTDIRGLDRILLSLDLKKAKSFCVRCLGFRHNRAEERRTGEIILSSHKAKVDLEKPDAIVYIIRINKRVAVSLRRYETGNFTARNPNKRPFFHPLALSPKLACLFLNLARLREGNTVLDPFCGSGSILIEAGLMNLKAIGIDKDIEMLWGCARNLEHYGVEAEIMEGDATDIRLVDSEGKPKTVDAIVTDPPYARASKVFSMPPEELYSAFLKSAYRTLRPGGYLVFSVPHDTRIGYPINKVEGRQEPSSNQGGDLKAGFEERGNFLYYVHKSLTRRIYVLRKAVQD